MSKRVETPEEMVERHWQKVQDGSCVVTMFDLLDMVRERDQQLLDPERVARVMRGVLVTSDDWESMSAHVRKEWLQTATDFVAAMRRA